MTLRNSSTLEDNAHFRKIADKYLLSTPMGNDCFTLKRGGRKSQCHKKAFLSLCPKYVLYISNTFTHFNHHHSNQSDYHVCPEIQRFFIVL